MRSRHPESETEADLLSVIKDAAHEKTESHSEAEEVEREEVEQYLRKGKLTLRWRNRKKIIAYRFISIRDLKNLYNKGMRQEKAQKSLM